MKKIWLVFFLMFRMALPAQSGWTAPPEADNLINPLAGDETSLETGKKIFQSLCAACHGKTGKGDVPSMQSLNPKPTDFTSPDFQKQSDGAIFWKLSEGRGMMAAYKNMLSEKERWAVVNYLRHLGKQDENNNKTGEIRQTQPPQNSERKTTPAATKMLADETVEAFPFTVLINAKTTRIMQPRGFGLNIQHRFGAVKFDEGLLTNFLGLDLAANMRFAFEIPYNERLMFEIGRTRYGKYYDFGFKYLLLRQTASNRIPVSIAWYENLAVYTDKAPVYSENATFADGSLFEYKFYHRLYYDNQLIVSRKFSDRLSGQITLQFVWRNLTPYSEHPPYKNYVLAFPVALRYKLTFTQALSLEIMPNTQPKTFPVSIGYEVASSGNHVFQITLTNTDRFLGQTIFSNPTAKIGKQGMMLGFNLIRYF
jgi:mono/diheme cytochrome c family protein